MLDEITWYDHATFRIDGEKVVYIDPWEFDGGPKADIVLVSHDHFDHCSREDVDKVAGPDTVVVTTADCAPKFSDAYEVVVLKPGASTKVEGVPIEGVPAYNPAKKFHPRSNDWLGFVITMNGKRYYYVGDSDVTPEMKAVKADVIMVPVGGTYTMDAQEAAEAVSQMDVQVAVPYHWGKIVGSLDDANTFQERCDKEVVILPKALKR